MIRLKDDEFHSITYFIKDNYGINLTKKRPLIEGRLGNYIHNLGFDNFSDYFEYAKKDKKNNEITMLINKLTTNHTYFLRENTHFDYYKEIVLPWIDKELKSKDLRVWSAGCSSGQEPYTLSMITLDYLEPYTDRWDSTILASDISDKALLAAKKGIYTKEDLINIPNNWMDKYFISTENDNYSVSDVLRNNVVFRNFNLLSNYNFKKPFQVIFCKNVMIYFDVKTKNKIIDKLYDAMLPGGYLFIGLSESLSACEHSFKYVKPSIYQK